MRVYIASRYQLPESVEIYEKLLEKKIDVFLPKTINLDAKTSEERKRVYDICLKKIRVDCDVILFIYPFGFSVSSEFGMAAMLKALGYQKTIILLNLSDEEISVPELEGMMEPAIDKVFTDIDTLVKFLEKLATEAE